MKKKSVCIIALMLLVSLAGCAGQDPGKAEDHHQTAVRSTADTASDSEVSESSSAGTIIEETAAEMPEPAKSEQQKEETTEPAAPEISEPPQTAIPPQESAAKPEASPVQTQKPASNTQKPQSSEPPKTENTAPTAPIESLKEPEPTAPPAVTESPKGFTQADHEHIVAEVTAYAESYRAKGFTFEWSDELEFGWDVGYMGTPRIGRDGVEGTIRTLKYHIDLIYDTGTNPAYGLTSNSVRYRVVQIEIDGGIAYAVIYG